MASEVLGAADAAAADGEVALGEVVDDEESRREAGRFEALLDAIVWRVAPVVERDVARLATAHPGLDRDTLARLVVTRGVRRTAALSALTALPGGATATAGVPAVLALQVATVHAVATVYDQQRSPTARRDLLLVLAGDRSRAVLDAVGVSVPERLRRSDVDARLGADREPMVRRLLAGLVVRWVRRRAVSSVGRVVPVAGAAVAWVTDRAATREIGERALRYYGSD